MWKPLLRLEYFISSLFCCFFGCVWCNSQPCGCFGTGAAGDAVPDVGSAAALRERGVVWRGQWAARRPSHYRHRALRSRHRGETCFVFVFSVFSKKKKRLSLRRHIDRLFIRDTCKSRWNQDSFVAGLIFLQRCGASTEALFWIIYKTFFPFAFSRAFSFGLLFY